MKSGLYTALLAATALAATPAWAVETLSVTVENITQGKPVPEQHVLCKPTADGKSTGGENLRPAIAWTDAPEGTKSYAVIVSDPDVPADFSKAGKDGQVIEKDAPRQLFYHWGLADIPADKTHLPGGKTDAPIGFGAPVTNDLGKYIKDARHYGGPCPPWNDQRLHHYHFTVYALDVPSLQLKRHTTAKQLAELLASSPHVLAAESVIGTYTLNKALRD